MGFCDYQCFIHSVGSQCLETHSECCGTHKYITDEDSDNSDNSHSRNGKGSGEAVCILFDISSKISDPKIALQLLKNGKAKNIRIRHDITYDWDAIDFNDFDGNDENCDADNGMGYYDSENHQTSDYNPKIPWKVNNEHRNKPYKKLFWVISMCPTCYTFLTTQKDKEWCSEYIREMCERYDLLYKKKSDVCKYVRKKYKWLIEIIESYSSSL